METTGIISIYVTMYNIHMDQTTAQPTPGVPVQPVSPVKKFLPFILGGVLILLLLLGSIILFSPSSSSKKNIPTPTPRPTATPFPPPPTLPVATKAVATNSAVVASTKIGRLAFIKNGDIYNSDLASFSILVKNATAAADKLTWSPMGNFLSWRPVTLATPSALTVYDRDKKTTITIRPSNDISSELIDYAWSGDEKQIAVLYRNQSYHIDLVSIASSSARTIPLLNRSVSIKQIIWPNSRTIIFSGDDGINRLDIASSTTRLLIDNNQVMHMKLSFDKTKLLYSTGNDQKSDLYIVNTDGLNNQFISIIASKVDMGTTGLPSTILHNGFIPYALWFPKGDKLMVGYHYLTNLPLVGTYDLVNNSFTAISPFALYENDFMVDDLRLVGSRINTFGASPSWQISFFTLEDNAKLATIRVIPEANSPAFFGNDLLPAGNTF